LCEGVCARALRQACHMHGFAEKVHVHMLENIWIMVTCSIRAILSFIHMCSHRFHPYWLSHVSQVLFACLMCCICALSCCLMICERSEDPQMISRLEHKSLLAWMRECVLVFCATQATYLKCKWLIYYVNKQLVSQH
jgi:hypothetical protein